MDEDSAPVLTQAGPDHDGFFDPGVGRAENLSALDGLGFFLGEAQGIRMTVDLQEAAAVQKEEIGIESFLVGKVLVPSSEAEAVDVFVGVRAWLELAFQDAVGEESDDVQGHIIGTTLTFLKGSKVAS